MAFKLGDVIIDRLQFGYGAKKNGAPLYALTQLNNANIDITADTTDINDKDGNLVYRKYSGKKGEVTAQNAFINLAIIEALSAADAAGPVPGCRNDLAELRHRCDGRSRAAPARAQSARRRQRARPGLRGAFHAG